MSNKALVVIDMELRLTMETAVQKCLMQHVRMKAEFAFMEK